MKKMFNRVCTNVTLKAMSLKQKLQFPNNIVRYALFYEDSLLGMVIAFS